MESQGFNGMLWRGPGASYPPPITRSSCSEQATIWGIHQGHYAVVQKTSGIADHLKSYYRPSLIHTAILFFSSVSHTMLNICRLPDIHSPNYRGWRWHDSACTYIQASLNILDISPNDSPSFFFLCTNLGLLLYSHTLITLPYHWLIFTFAPWNIVVNNRRIHHWRTIY